MHLFSDIIIDICSKPKASVDYSVGVIRSHRGYPRKRPRPDVCAITVPIKERKTLIIETVTENNTFPPGLTLQNVLIDGRKTENISTMKDVTLHGNTSKALKIAVDFRWKRRTMKGFVLQYQGTLNQFYLYEFVNFRIVKIHYGCIII